MRGRFGTERRDDPRIQSGTTFCFKAPHGLDPEHKEGTINVSNPEHLLVLKALCRADPEHNAGTIHASNPENLVFKTPRRDNPEKNTGMIHASNPEHFLVFKAPRGDDPEQNAGTIHASMHSGSQAIITS